MLTDAAVAPRQEFERRIRAWLSYSDAEITGIIQRAREADALVKSSGLFDYTLVNKQLEMTTEKLQDLISENRPDLIPPRSEVRETTNGIPRSQLHPLACLPCADNRALLTTLAGGHLTGAVPGCLRGPRLGLQGNHGSHGHGHGRLGAAPLQKPADPFSGPSMAPFSVTLRGPAAPAAKFPFFALPPQVKVAVSMAVRKPKEHEEEGIHYKFQGKADAFKKMIEKGEIIADTKVS